MATYGTLQNIQRSFGGVANVTEAGMSDKGELTIKFSRPLVYPRALLEDFDPLYQE